MNRKTVLFIMRHGYFGYVRPVWDRLLNEPFIKLKMIEAAQVRGREDDLRSADLLVTVHSSVLDIIQSLDRMKGIVPSLTLQDGIIEYRSSARRVQKIFRYRPLRTDFIAVFGDRSKHLLCASGVEADRIFVTGSPRFDHYMRTTVPSDGHLLITMANRPAHRPTRVAAFYWILGQTLEHCEREGIAYKLRLSRGIRPGGVEAFDRLSDLDPHLAYRLSVAVDADPAPLEDDVRESRAVITTPSTVSVEAMALGRPVGHLLFDCETTFLQTAWAMRCVEDIPEVVAELLNPPKMKLEFQDVILQENLLSDGNSTERVLEVIYGILGIGQRRRI